MHPKDISIQDYSYSLPDERIAAFPLTERDDSKLLIYKEGIIREDIYKNIAGHLPANSLLVFNNTRVIPARILFQKISGAVIEIFCLEPYNTQLEHNLVMFKKEKIEWKCMIGGAAKWKAGTLTKQFTVDEGNVEFTARLTEKLADAYVVEFSWQPPHLTFAEVIGQAGIVPLPPYIKRKPIESDKIRYQTVFGKLDGSVAAPTAGLHFTPNIFSSLEAKSISCSYLTLHVGAGTFKPVSAASLQGHTMHAEWIEVSSPVIHEIIQHIGQNITAVGTTSLRTLESLYWMGVKTILNPSFNLDDLVIKQWDVYDAPLNDAQVSPLESLTSLLNWMKKNNYERLFTQTQILIAPGYHFKIAGSLVTNFHQPQSTLLLLVAAAIGDDWHKIYSYAMENDFRFLSYGDGSLLFFRGAPE